MLPYWLSEWSLVIAITQISSYILCCGYYEYFYKGRQLRPTVDYKKTMPVVLINIIFGVVITTLLFGYYFQPQLNYKFSIYSTLRGLFISLLCSISVGISHYYHHTILFLRNNFHSMHHRTDKATKPIDCLYSHPVEFIVGYQIYILIACYLINVHYICMIIGVMFAVRQSAKGHLSLTGYKSEHNIHHDSNNKNYDADPHVIGKLSNTYKKGYLTTKDIQKHPLIVFVLKDVFGYPSD